MSRVLATSQWFAEHSGKIAIVGIGVLGDRILCYGLDYLLYPLVIWYYGPLWGGLVMTGTSFVVCLLLIRFYDWAKKDWLAIEAIKGLKEYRGTNYLGRLISWTLRLNDLAACIVLSVKFDPFITTLYLRQGCYNGMTRRDWRIYFMSWFISNAYWVLACWLGVSVVEWLWMNVTGAGIWG